MIFKDKIKIFHLISFDALIFCKRLNIIPKKDIKLMKIAGAVYLVQNVLNLVSSFSFNVFLLIKNFKNISDIQKVKLAIVAAINKNAEMLFFTAPQISVAQD